MKSFCAVIAVMAVVSASGASLAARALEPAAPQAAAQSTTPPTLIPLSGELKTPNGDPRTGSVMLVVSLYAGHDDPTPLWIERQLVTLDAAGRYTVVAGSTLEAGVPPELFLSGGGRWIGVAVEGEAEQPRAQMVSAPYALKAREADTLTGKSSADFVLTDQLKASVKAAMKAAADVHATATANRVVKYSDAAGTLADSSITDTGASVSTLLPVGIGTSSPIIPLQVIGRLGGYGSTTGTGFILSGGAANVTPEIYADYISGSEVGLHMSSYSGRGTAKGLTVTPSGNIGIGTTAPVAPLQVIGLIGAYGATNGTGFMLSGGSANVTPEIYSDYISGSEVGLHMTTFSGRGTAKGLTLDTAGNVGIGTAAPNAKLHVAGSVTVDGNIGAKYQDVAEWVETSSPLDAATVVIVDPLMPNRVLAASRAYDTRVAGAISGRPGLLLGEASDTKAMVAQSGRVKVKVDAKYGAIKIGDLLVTSPTPGYAMRSRPMKVGGQSLHRPGTLLGKALEALPSGQGEILVLLTLQ